MERIRVRGKGMEDERKEIGREREKGHGGSGN